MNPNIFNRHGEQRIGRYKLLLMSIFVLIAVRPFMEDLVEVTLLADIVFTLVLISGVYSLNKNPNAYRVSWLLASAVLILKIIDQLWNRVDSLDTVQLLFSILFVGQMIFVIVKQLLIVQEVTGDLVMGGACVFVLLGLLWSFIYCLLEIYYPNSFNFVEGKVNVHSNFLYFSYVTLTTVGYGDVLAVSKQARGLANLEAIVGQLYLAIMVSRLVGLHTSKSRHKFD